MLKATENTHVKIRPGLLFCQILSVYKSTQQAFWRSCPLLTGMKNIPHNAKQATRCIGLYKQAGDQTSLTVVQKIIRPYLDQLCRLFIGQGPDDAVTTGKSFVQHL